MDDQVHPYSDTEQSIGMTLKDIAKILRSRRARFGDLVALQTITFLFAGNPVAMFSHNELRDTCLSIAESVRKWCIQKFREYGGPNAGPEAVNRMIGKDRNDVIAANEALVRFNGFIDVVREIESRIEGKEESHKIILPGAG